MSNATKKLNVLTLCSWYPNTTNPTLGNFVQKHAESAGIFNDVTVLAMFSSPSVDKIVIDKESKNGITEYIVYYPKSTYRIKFLNKIRGYFVQKKAFKKVYSEIKNSTGKPDIVHLNIVYPLGTWALHLKRKENIPYVITENSTGLHVDSEHAYPYSVLKLCKLIIQNASVLLPVSENLKNYMKQLAPASQFEIISNVVDEHKFKLKTALQGSQIKLIHISTGFDPHKNLTGIINTLKRISNYRTDFHLDIVSDGDTLYAKELVKSLGCEAFISFHSTKTTIEIAEMLEQSDALLMFSNYENFPCVIAESLMTGIPVISSNVNGIPEHVNSQNGILVEPRNEDQLEKAIVQFLNTEIVFNKDEIRQYAEAHFSYQSVGKSFDTVYRKVLAQN